MKMKLFSLSILLISINIFAQDYSKLSEINLTKVSDYRDNEPKVEECANYILGQSIESNELNKPYCIKFIMKWMEGTPDYSFSLGTDFTDFCKNNTDFELHPKSWTVTIID